MDRKEPSDLELWQAEVTRRRFLLGVGFAAASVYARPLLGTAQAGLPDDFSAVAFPTARPPAGWPKAPVSFAVIGDFGAGNVHVDEKMPESTVNPNAQNVAEGVAQYATVRSDAYVISVGDNVYVPYYGSPETPPPEAEGTNEPPGGSKYFRALTITPYDQAVGVLYHQFIKFPDGSSSIYAKHGARKQRFFTVIGDHDWWHQPRVEVTNLPYYRMDHAKYPAPIEGQPYYFPNSTGNEVSYYLEYFGNQGEGSSSGNTRYWDRIENNIHWIALSSDANETLLGTLSNAYYQEDAFPPENLTPGMDNLKNSAQGKWFQDVAGKPNRADWRFVFTHYPPFTSSSSKDGHKGHDPANYMQWGYEDFDVDMVFSGHVHAYERLYVDGVTYVTCGAGGTFESLATFEKPPGGPSQMQVEKKYGFLTAEQSPGKIFFSYISIPPADDSGLVTDSPALSDRFVLLKRGVLSAKDDFAELRSIHITSGGGTIRMIRDYTYTGNLLGRGRLTKSGRGEFTLAKESSHFSGEIMLSNGALLLGLDQALGKDVSLVLDGGTLKASGVTQEFVTPLSVQKPSTLEGDSGTKLSFADSSAVKWPRLATLTVHGDPGPDSIRFGNSSSALTPEQISRIRFQKRGRAKLTEDGYLVPV